MSNRYAIGDWMSVELQTGVSWPTDASGGQSVPEYLIIDSAGDVVASGEQIRPVLTVPGLHVVERQIGPEFSAGHYTLVARWKVASNSFNRGKVFFFEVGSRGHSAGAIVGMHHYEAPNVDYLVTQTDSGTLEARREPQ